MTRSKSMDSLILACGGAGFRIPGGKVNRGGLGSAGRFRAAEEVVDAPPVLFGAVEDEENLGGAAKLQAFAELVADEASGGGQGFDGGLLLRFAAHDADVNPGLLHVRRH